MKFVKKPVEVEAFLLGLDYMPDWFMDRVTANDVILHNTPRLGVWCEIRTLEGVMKAYQGVDYIVKGVDGELYPCKRDIFERTYTRVD